MNIAPAPFYLAAIRGQHRLTWPALLAELIDNAQDAGATSIVLDFLIKSKKVVSFRATDNGRGCDDLRRMLAPGHRHDHETTISGRYGIGAKEAMICLGNRVSINSISGGVQRMVTVDWSVVVRANTWDVDDPTEVPTGSPSGTSIEIRDIIKTPPDPWADLKQTLGRLYAPALRKGSFQIVIRRGKEETVAPVDEPALDLEEADTLVFSPTKNAQVRMGMIREPGQRALQGVTVAIATRVVKARTRIGLGGEPTPGLYGYALLSRGWHLGKNKDELSPSDQQLLGNAIAKRFRSLIEHARRAGEDVLLAEHNNILGLLDTAIRRERDRNRKAKRRPASNQTGTILPTGSGRRHGRAQRTQPGTTFAGPGAGTSSLFSIQRDARGDAPLFTLEEDRSVYINTNHAFYGHIAGNMQALAPLALAFFASQIHLRGERLLPFEETIAEDVDRQAHAWSYLLERYVEANRIAVENSNAAS